MHQFLLSLSLLMGMVALAPSDALAAQSVNLLIMGEDVDKDTVPRDSRVFSRVLHQMQEVLNTRGFNVKDETAITVGKFGQGRSRRTDAELIDIAKLVSTPIDVVTIFQIFASAERLPYTTKIRVRVTGRMLQPHSGNAIGHFEVAPDDPFLSHPDCNRECLLEEVGKNAKVLGDQVADVLGKKLDHLKGGRGGGGPPPRVSTPSPSGEGQKPPKGAGDHRPVATAPAPVGGGTVEHQGMANTYALTFISFSQQEMMKIEEYLEIFSGYQSYRPTRTQGRQYEYEYVSHIEPEKLRRNLQKTLWEIKLDGNIDFNGNRYRVEKIEFRQERPGQSRSEW